MSTDVFLHVGPPKTGTTFLQRKVFPNIPGVFDVYSRAPDLLARINRDLVQCHPLRVSLDGLRREVDTLVSNCGSDTLLISWEGLFGFEEIAFVNNVHTAEGLRALFPEAKVILSVRRQDNYAESAYRQVLHTYRSVSPEDFVGWQRDGTFAPRVFSYHQSKPGIDALSLDWTPYIDNYVRLFGSDNVKVLVYEELSSDPAEYISRLCDYMGCNGYSLPPITEENRGYSIMACWLARGLNRFVHTPTRRWGVIPNQPFLATLQARAHGRNLCWVLAGISRRLSLRWVLQEVVDRVFYVPGHPFSAKLRNGLLDIHRHANQLLDERFALGLGRYGYF